MMLSSGSDIDLSSPIVAADCGRFQRCADAAVPVSHISFTSTATRSSPPLPALAGPGAAASRHPRFKGHASSTATAAAAGPMLALGSALAVCGPHATPMTLLARDLDSGLLLQTVGRGAPPALALSQSFRSTSVSPPPPPPGIVGRSLSRSPSSSAASLSSSSSSASTHSASRGSIILELESDDDLDLPDLIASPASVNEGSAMDLTTPHHVNFASVVSTADALISSSPANALMDGSSPASVGLDPQTPCPQPRRGVVRIQQLQTIACSDPVQPQQHLEQVQEACAASTPSAVVAASSAQAAHGGSMAPPSMMRQVSFVSSMSRLKLKSLHERTHQAQSSAPSAAAVVPAPPLAQKRTLRDAFAPPTIAAAAGATLDDARLTVGSGTLNAMDSDMDDSDSDDAMDVSNTPVPPARRAPPKRSRLDPSPLARGVSSLAVMSVNMNNAAAGGSLAPPRLTFEGIGATSGGSARPLMRRTKSLNVSAGSRISASFGKFVAAAGSPTNGGVGAGFDFGGTLPGVETPRPPLARGPLSSSADEMPTAIEAVRPNTASPRPAGAPLLPSTMGKCDSIRRITPDTLALLIDGRITGVARAIIIDVRFPYEYGGGHVRGAINVNSFEDLDTMFFGRTTSGSTKRAAAAMHDTALIFHCEFSSHRAPAMAMHLRAQDRIVNMARYPDVHFPEIYVLEGGYKRFFEEMPHRCAPQMYVPMDASEYREQCRQEIAERKQSLARSKSGCESFAPSLNRTKSNGGGMAMAAPPSRPMSACLVASMNLHFGTGSTATATASAVSASKGMMLDSVPSSPVSPCIGFAARMGGGHGRPSKWCESPI